MDTVTPAAPTASLDARLAALEDRLARAEARLPEDRVALVVFSGDLDKVLAAFVIATGAAALGQQVSVFFTFWGLAALKKGRMLGGKNLAQQMLTLMTPDGTRSMGISEMNYFGAGAVMLRSLMKEKGVASVEELVAMARDLGVRFVACEMSRDVMGVSDAELVDGIEHGGVAAFLGDALRARATMFI